jgi:hypothetical protein
MKKNKKILSAIVFLSSLLMGCDVSDTLYKGDTLSCTSFSVGLVFQADATKSYHATFNDDSIPMGKYNSILRSKLTGTLKVYNGTETTPELTQELTIIPAQTIKLIQLPGQTVQLYESGGSDEVDPDSNAVKVRFFYSATTLPDSVRMIVQSKKNNVSVTTYDGVDTLMITRGKLSRYVNLNLAKYWSINQTMANFYYTLHNVDNPASPLLLGTRRLFLLSAAETGTVTNTTGPVYTYKLMTYQIGRAGSGYTNSFVFGNKWGE